MTMDEFLTEVSDWLEDYREAKRTFNHYEANLMARLIADAVERKDNV